MVIKLKNQNPGVQFAIFFALTVAMILVNLMINSIFFPGVANILSNKAPTAVQVNQFKGFQFVSTFLIFAMPALLYGFLADERPLNYLGVKRDARVKFLFASLLMLIAVQPLAMVLGEWNSHADFGQTIRRLEDLSEKAMEKFLVMNSPGDLLVNILVVAILPAVAEELFFRGSLQNILEKWTQRPVIAIVLASFFFAFFHFSFYKFLPIFVLGIVLGALFHITRNLWYSIFFHFINNTMALLASYYAQRNDFMKQLANDDMKLSWWIGLASLLVTLALFYYLRTKNPYVPLEKTWQRNIFQDQPNTPR